MPICPWCRLSALAQFQLPRLSSNAAPSGETLDLTGAGLGGSGGECAVDQRSQSTTAAMTTKLPEDAVDLSVVPPLSALPEEGQRGVRSTAHCLSTRSLRQAVISQLPWVRGSRGTCRRAVLLCSACEGVGECGHPRGETGPVVGDRAEVAGSGAFQ